MEKDETLTYEELTKRCRKLEDEVNNLCQLNSKLQEELDSYKAPKCEKAEPDYDELRVDNQKLQDKIEILENEILALNYSLGHLFHELRFSWLDNSTLEEDYNREHKRARRLFDEVERLKNKAK